MESLITLKNLLTAIDLLLVAFLVYRVLLIIRGTRAVQMLIGLSLIIFLYFLARLFDLATLGWILGNFLSSIILVVIVIFQEEIRRGLTKVGIKPFFFGSSKKVSNKTIEDLALAVNGLVKEQLGALIVIQKEVGLEEFLEDAITIDAIMNRKLLVSIFQKASPLHDGAVVIDNDRIKAAGCFLPLSFDPDLDPNLGTRHRSALGLSERSDAIVVVVSEENGSVSLVREGKIHRNLDVGSLQEQLFKFLRQDEVKFADKE